MAKTNAFNNLCSATQMGMRRPQRLVSYSSFDRNIPCENSCYIPCFLTQKPGMAHKKDIC
jgi:hypothetical protein